ncbi:helix-turn-helix transcriptional regulator [Glaciimonas immobilis]|uniref:helix-turn-helix transcriptional regulator n=1 Tax=Glaciimonas immobilis TaxID=728004 RepID=UPI0035D451EC
MLQLRDVIAETSLSRSTIFRRIDQGLFPKQIQISARRVAWRSSDINAYLDACTNPQIKK